MGILSYGEMMDCKVGMLRVAESWLFVRVETHPGIFRFIKFFFGHVLLAAMWTGAHSLNTIGFIASPIYKFSP